MKKFHSDRKELGYTYELLRQVVHTGRVPRSETMLRILHAMRFSPTQTRKILELVYGEFSPIDRFPATTPSDTDEIRSAGSDEITEAAAVESALPNISRENDKTPAPSYLEETSETASGLTRSLSKIPLQGNEDFWEVVRNVAAIAERKARESTRRKEDQPLLFGKEPEAIYQFLVRRTKVPPYMSKGDNLPLSFAEGIDYQDRYRGALLGAVIGLLLGRPAQGLSPRDVAELYGHLAGYAPQIAPNPGSADSDPPTPGPLLLARALLKDGKVDPEEIASLFASASFRFRGGSEAEFAENIKERGYSWFEAGVNAAESLPAARITALSLLRAADFRRLKMEAGIIAAITHPNPAAIAGAIVQAAAVSRLLHTPAGTLDILGFVRTLPTAIAGLEPDRTVRSRTSRQGPTLLRRLGTELAALLLRRAEIEEIRDALGNGPSVQEGLPFAWACFLRSPEDFTEAVLPAVNLGNDAECAASMAGSLCGAYRGISGIPRRFLDGLPGREELVATADELLSLSRRDPERGSAPSPTAS